MTIAQRISVAENGHPRRDSRPGLTIVVPCFNEQEGIASLRDALRACERRLAQVYDFFVIFVDDGSEDGTLFELREAFDDLPNYSVVQHSSNRGISAAIMTGIREASTELVASIDSDCTYDPMQLAHLVPLMSDDVDLVTASPYHPDGDVLNLPQWRLALSWLASFIYGRVMWLKIHTYTSCFRVYRRSAVLDLPITNGGFTGVPELLWKLHRTGGKIVECPAILKARELGQSKMRIAQVSWGHFRLLSKILIQRLFSPVPKSLRQPASAA